MASLVWQVGGRSEAETYASVLLRTEFEGDFYASVLIITELVAWQVLFGRWVAGLKQRHMHRFCLESSLKVPLGIDFTEIELLTSIRGNETDHLALLEFKKSISRDPYGILLSWNTSTHFCDWSGITCNLKLQRVTQLVLSRYKLEGSISPHIGNLSYMINFDLAVNNIHGKIPQELGRLSRLQQLSLRNNLLVGEIPTNLTGCNDLRFLYLQRNNLTGKIPIEIGSLQKLEWWVISTNKLTGEIPSFIGNLTSLTVIDVDSNNFEGHIPQEICHFKNLTFASFGQNKFTGTLPSCLYNMSALTMISATDNQLSGSLPPNMFHTLPNLQEFYIAENQISGRIPPSITNASAFFLALEASRNSLTGQIPSMGKFQYLDIISLSWNHLGDNSTTDFDFLESLANSSVSAELERRGLLPLQSRNTHSVMFRTPSFASVCFSSCCRYLV
ncbi:putative receptor-like protein kinase At3g47110 [Vigna angularis]|nr:putative receptor-like protein kinase At3g47110 [Vigna angularis]